MAWGLGEAEQGHGAVLCVSEEGGRCFGDGKWLCVLGARQMGVTHAPDAGDVVGGARCTCTRAGRRLALVTRPHLPGLTGQRRKAEETGVLAGVTQCGRGRKWG